MDEWDFWGDGWTLLKLTLLKTLRSYSSKVSTRGLSRFCATKPLIKHFLCRKYVQVLWLSLSLTYFHPKLIYWINLDNQSKADFLWFTEWHRQLLETHAIIGPLLSRHLPGGVWQGGGLRRCIALNSKSYWAITATPARPRGCPIFWSFLIELLFLLLFFLSFFLLFFLLFFLPNDRAFKAQLLHFPMYLT